MANHLTVKDLKKKLEKLPDDGKIVFFNTDTFIPGMYYVTSVTIWKKNMSEDEFQVELESNHKSIAKGWDYYGN